MSASQDTPTTTWPPEPTGSFTWVQAPWGWVLRCPPLAALAPHFFTVRGLSPGKGHLADAGEWDRVASLAGVSADHVWRLHQVHGCRTLIVDTPTMPGTPLEPADAAATTRVDVALAVKTADCVPILLADRHRRAVGAVHAGWRGTASRIVVQAVETMARIAGADPGELVAAIGPSIGACCYEVGPELRRAFTELGHAPAALDRWFTPDRGDGRAHLNLWRANRDQLVAAGLAPEQIHVAGLCTATHLDWFYSYRKEGTRAGRMLAVIRRA